MSGERMSEEEFNEAAAGTGHFGQTATLVRNRFIVEARRARASEAALREENERLRGALKEILDFGQAHCGCNPVCRCTSTEALLAYRDEVNGAARAALSKEPTP